MSPLPFILVRWVNHPVPYVIDCAWLIGLCCPEASASLGCKAVEEYSPLQDMPPDMNDTGISQPSKHAIEPAKHANKPAKHANELAKHANELAKHADGPSEHTSDPSKYADDLVGVGALHDEQVLKQEQQGSDLILNGRASLCISESNTASSLPTASCERNIPKDADLANAGQSVFERCHGWLSNMQGRADGVLSIWSWYGKGGLADSALNNSGNVDPRTSSRRSNHWSTKTERSSDERPVHAMKTTDVRVLLGQAKDTGRTYRVCMIPD